MKLFTPRVSVAPLRILPADASEMVSQVLFGETVEQVRIDGNWILIKCERDGYEGWLDKNQVREIDKATNWNAIVCSRELRVLKSDSELILPLGSKVELEGDMIRLEDEVYSYKGDCTEKLQASQEVLLKLLMQWNSCSYLWGGRSVYGADCSGFTQSTLELFGAAIERDSSKQAKEGTPIKFENRACGDLAFFAKENGKIFHVGILTSANEIAHCSAFFRIDQFTAEGIYRASENRISHKLHSIKRIINFKN